MKCPHCGREIETQQKRAAESRWDTAEIAKELRDRMTYFYGQSDGSFRFPNSCEGDMLRMTARLLARLPNAKVRDAE